MTEMTENGVHPDTVRPDVTGREDTEEAHSREEPEHGNREHDGEKACPSAGDPTDAEPKWAVGDQCRTVWSEDGKEYPATVVSVDGKQCRVRFTGYGNKEDVELSALKSPAAAPQMKNLHSQGWKPGALCWAMYSVDGRFYPAVVLWVKGQRCCVRFDHYNNEEEQDVNCLLNPSEFYGPSIVRVKAKERPGNQSNMGNDTDERKGGQQAAGAEKPANHSFPLFPPFPPPFQLGSEDPSSFLPPLPPIWMFDGKESDGSPCTKTVSSLLMLWYMCGFHTGSFMTWQMFKSPSKE